MPRINAVAKLPANFDGKEQYAAISPLLPTKPLVEGKKSCVVDFFILASPE